MKDGYEVSHSFIIEFEVEGIRIRYFLRKDNGEVLRESRKIEEEIATFFSNLYAPSPLSALCGRARLESYLGL